jgi:hypothetical protein
MTFLIEIKAAPLLVHWYFTKSVGVVLSRDIAERIKIKIREEERVERIQKITSTPAAYAGGTLLTSTLENVRSRAGNTLMSNRDDDTAIDRVTEVLNT